MSVTGDDELVPVMVPKRDLSAVYALLGRRSGGTRRIVEGSSAGRVDQSGAASAGELAVTRRAQLEEFGVALLAV